MNPRLTVTKICVALLAIATILLPSGAVGSEKFTPAPPPAPGKALVYVYRQGKMVGAAGYDLIFVNNEYMAGVHNGNYAYREVPPGTLVFSSLSRLKVIPGAILEAELMKLQKEAKELFRMDVEAGKTYYIRIYVTGKGHKMELVDEERGTKEISKLNLAKD
jgi:hypothetical protein